MWCQQLNDLLTEYGPEADDTIEEIPKLLSHVAEEDPFIDLCNEGGLSFSDHIFAMMIILDADEEANVSESEEYTYQLTAYANREDIFPDFCSYPPPANDTDRTAYLNSLLPMQYHVYLACNKNLDNNLSLVYSNLTDPAIFALAKLLYEQLKSKQAN